MTHTLLDSRRVASPAEARLDPSSVVGNRAQIRRFGGPQRKEVGLTVLACEREVTPRLIGVTWSRCGQTSGRNSWSAS